MRAVIYARYSSENQREASIEDQIEVCRRYAERQGWTITQTYDDRAMSGASRLSRPGFLRMLAHGEAGRFDVLICEAIDRLGRKLSDVSDVFDRLTFRRVAVHATSVGLLTHMHIGIMGTMAQMGLADLREKTKRGQLGRARAGRIPGGLAYGYEVVTPAAGSRDGGERRIKPDEAQVIQRIFKAYAAGKSPRHIAYELNADGIPGPGSRAWGDTTLRGQPERGTGILNNTLYIGLLSWNRCSYVKDPSTGRRVARLNAMDQREEVAVPELRIIDQALWDAVHARRMALRFEIGRTKAGQPLNVAHRRKFLLSGLLTCGCCGAGYTIMATDRYGCAQHRSKGTCANSSTIRRQRIEERVLSGLKDRMLDPQLVAEFVRAFAEEMAALQRGAAQAAGKLQNDLSDAERKLEGVLRAVENGSWSDALQTRLRELEMRKADLLAQLKAAGKPTPVIQLHPNAADIYSCQVAELEKALADPEIAGEAAEALGALIERVVLTPDPDAPDGLRAELHGDLAMILNLAAGASPKPADPGSRGGYNERPPGTGMPGRRLSVVAGEELERAITQLGLRGAMLYGRAGTTNADDRRFDGLPCYRRTAPRTDLPASANPGRPGPRSLLLRIWRRDRRDVRELRYRLVL